MLLPHVNPPRPAVLDPAQLVRIEALHRGFLYQHLYAAQCLLISASIGTLSVAVETDEDVELIFVDRHVYVQVKHRHDALAWDDISGALDRFADLRAAHIAGHRQGVPEFVIVTNAPPNGPLATRMAANDWPADVRVDWPQAEADRKGLPAPPSSLLDAIERARERATALPFALLAPETLVWKLAGVITLAATGQKDDLDHVFQVETLPELFEQLVLQLQDLPAPPSPYRLQIDEPELATGERVRLITGYSGSGKTSWVAQAAQHADGILLYLDVGDVAGPALANGLARDLAGRLYGNGGQLGQVLLPGASGREILRSLSGRIAEDGQTVTVALDNAHHIPSEDLIAVVQAAAAVRFVLLCRPVAEVAAIEAILGIARENLAGWAPDTVAAEAAEAGCRANGGDCQRLIDLTGGLPLYVQNAVAIAVAEYDSSLVAFCDQLAASTHSIETAQEMILGRLFAALPQAVGRTADLLSLCDVPISRADALAYLASGGQDNAAVAASLRHLRTVGLLQVYSGDKLKIHDAARIIGKARLAAEGIEVLQRHRMALLAVILAGVKNDWSLPKLSLFLRLTGEIGDLEPLVEIATDELFHELGVWPEIERFLEHGAADESLPADQRLKALDGLAFGDMKAGREDRIAGFLDQMDALIAAYDLGDEERLRVGMKRMNVLAAAGNRQGAEALMTALAGPLKGASAAHRRVFTYNAAAARFRLGDNARAVEMLSPLIGEYYRLLGITPQQVMGRNAPDLRRLLKPGDSQLDDIKHLADSLDLLAMSLDADGKFSPFARIHALKFYDLAQAPDSLFRVGQDLVDQFIGHRDYTGARQFMESTLLPQLQTLKLADYLIPVRSQYAVVLAYCGLFPQAEGEMARLQPYEAGLDERGRAELRNQRRFIAALKVSEPPPQWRPPLDFERRLKPAMDAISGAQPIAKARRNEPCPCGSGRKYKKCHGA